ncbi:MAG: M14 metallopeptidase family protein [Terracidiphilus sp.]
MDWHCCAALLLLFALVLAARSLSAQAREITTPREALGFNIGDDYQIATYSQLVSYWKEIASECDRCKLVEIGRTSEDRPQYMMIITSPENLKKLESYKGIVQKLAHADGLTDAQAHVLAAEGKPVVWIDGGLHADETVGSQQLMEQVYLMASRTDPETMHLLDDVIGLYVQVNPDGQDMVAKWYMREKDPSKRSLAGVPLLWQKYAGEDDNRDYYMANLPESTNVDRQLYIEWFPQIVSNHHQGDDSPAGTVISMPALCSPLNYNLDPLIPLEMTAAAVAVHTRLVAQGKGGTVMNSSDCWWNGAMFNSPFFHNMVGILTEIIGNPTPEEISLVASNQLPSAREPLPIAPQEWHYRQSIDYEIENDRALLSFAARNHEQLLYNLYRMGANSIEKGSRDNWTITPERIKALAAASEVKSCTQGSQGGSADTIDANGCRERPTTPTDLYKKILHDPAHRDPRGFIIPADQADKPNAAQFINALLKNGITVLKATSSFQVAGKSYRTGSYVVRTGQAFRPFVMDMFEPQDHPNSLLEPGEPAKPVYDVSGWTLAMQMGIQYDRVLDGFDGPFQKINGLLDPPPGSIVGPSTPAGYLVSHRVNNAFRLINRLLKANAEVFWLKNAAHADGEDLGTGAIWVPSSPASLLVLQNGVKELGVTLHAAAKAPIGEAYKLKPIRIGLYDVYGGLVFSGWIRWLLDQYEFQYQVVYPKTLDAGDLKDRFDVIVFSNDAFCRGGCGEPRIDNGGWGQKIPDDIPDEYKAWLGGISEQKTIPQLKTFVEQGGAVVAIGSSATMAGLLDVPLTNYLVEAGPDGKELPLPDAKFFIPGALLKLNIDDTQPLAFGMPRVVDVMYDNSSMFKLLPDTKEGHASTVGWFSGPNVLDSGWARGQSYLTGGTAIAEGKVGKGTVSLIGPEVTFRGQSSGTFKLLFNALYLNSMQETTLK